MCPLRFIFVLLGAMGLASYLGPLASGASGAGSTSSGQQGRSKFKQIGVWTVALAIFALHADLLLSMGYTKCAFEAVANVHRHHWALR
mmetsp:Transcript_51847/g.93067  ORF Transcript_51847/g.93067 Transcript_51847/m.93067 type:complete len:88 (-) Transcript_51847:130-393(-)